MNGEPDPLEALEHGEGLKRTFVPADEFLAQGQGLDRIEPENLRAELDAVIDPHLVDRDYTDGGT